MAGIRGKFTTYFQLFGWRGPWLALRTRLAGAPREVTVSVRSLPHPVRLRLKSTDVATLKKVLIDEEYALPLAKVPRTIVDAGANVGFASIFFARKFPQAKILAIEPELSNFALLKVNAAPYPNIRPLRCALWSEAGDLQVVDPGIGPWGFQAQRAGGSSSAKVIEKVPGRTLDSLLAEYGFDYLDILKIDIEGGEKEVFESCAPWIDKVGVIMTELHDHLREGCTRSFQLATRDFDSEATRGENVFKLRKPYLAQ